MPIGKHFTGVAGDYAAECAICGVPWYRSEMTLNDEGQLVCPDDQGGRTATALDRLRRPVNTPPKRRRYGG